MSYPDRKDAQAQLLLQQHDGLVGRGVQTEPVDTDQQQVGLLS
jgi:hypothetical protein